MGVVGATSVSVINTEIFQTIDFMPIWPLDTINGGVAEDFMIDESIPENAYDFLDPQLLSTCYEFFVMLTPTLFVEIKNK